MFQNSDTFNIFFDEEIIGFDAGECRIYWSTDNSSWTQWGDSANWQNTRWAMLGNKLQILGNGLDASHRYWKIVITTTFKDAGTPVRCTELESQTGTP